MKSEAKRIERELRHWWKKIRQSGSKERARDLADATAWATHAEAAVEVEQQKVSAQFDETEAAWFAKTPEGKENGPRENFYHSQAAKAAKLGAWACLVLEMVFAGGLALALLAFSKTVNFVAGVLVAVLIALMVKGAAGIAIGRFADRPMAARDWAVRLLLILTPVAFLLLFVVGLVRGVHLVWIALSFPWTMAGLMVVLPLMAGLLFALSGLYNWSARLTEQYRALDSLRREIVDLRKHCERMLAASGSSQARPQMVEQITKFAGALIILVGLAAVQGDFRADAASNSAGATAELWVDVSTSVDIDQERQVAMEIAGRIPDLTDRFGIVNWRLYAFTDQPWRARAIVQQAIAAEKPITCERNEAATFFRIQQEDTECESKKQEAAIARQGGLAQVSRNFRNSAEILQSQASSCTAVIDLLLRARATPEAKLVIVISDGAETCRPKGSPEIPPPQSGTKIALVLVGSVAQERKLGPADADTFSVRAAKLHSVAPWLTILPPWRATSRLL